MKFTALALREYRLTIALACCFVITGIWAFLNIPRQEDPAIPFRFALVTAIYPGASASRMEAEVLLPTEEALMDMAELESIESEARLNGGFLVLKVKDAYTDMAPIFDDLRRRLQVARERMPAGVQGPFLKEDFSEIYGIVATVSSSTASRAELGREAERLRRQLLLQAEVARVVVFGALEERAVVEYDDLDLADYNISPVKLSEFIKYQNYLLPGGSVMESGRQLQVEPRTTLQSLAELEDLAVAVPGEDESALLGDLLLVERRTKEPPDELARAGNQPAVGIAISMRQGGSLKAWGKQVEAVFTKAQEAQHLGGSGEVFNYDIVMHEPDRVNGRINKFFNNLLYSLLVVSVMLLLSLGLRTGLLVTAIMPMVVLTVFTVMYLTGMSLNLVSLTAFVIVLGILVDNHIVICERILSCRQSGMDKQKAATHAAESLQMPLLTAALVTIAGFLPIYLAQTSAGEYASPLFLIVSITLLVSIAFGLTLTPFLSIKLIRVPVLSDSGPGIDVTSPRLLAHPAYRGYRALLTALLRQRYLVLTCMLLAIIGAFLAAGHINRIFFPESDRPIMTLELIFPGGKPVTETEAALSKIDDYVSVNFAGQGVQSWLSTAGRNTPRFLLNLRPRQYLPEYGSMLFQLQDNERFEELAGGLRDFCAEHYPEALCRVRRIESGPAVGWPIQVRLSGNDIETLRASAQQVKNYLAGIDALANISDNWGEPVEQYQIHPNSEASARAGVLHAEIAAAAQGYLTGLPAGQIRNAEETLPIWVKARELKTPKQDLENLYVFAHQTDARPVQLKEVAQVVRSQAPPKILRSNYQRSITVQADVIDQNALTAIDDQIGHWLKSQDSSWPDGIRVEQGGAGLEARRANLSILKKTPWAGLIIVALLLAQTCSFRSTFIILSAVPMGLVGVCAGLIVTGQPFGFMTLVGIIALTGIVINNAIILLDRIRSNRENPDPAIGSTIECVVEAALNRIRPILITTVTTIGGILPLFLRGNPVFQPMAAALISGLLFSTLLVLIVLPVLYATLFNLNESSTEERSER